MKLDASEITPGLWQGSYPGPGPQTMSAGFDVLVLAAREIQRSSVYFPGVEVVHAPNNDAPNRYPFTTEDLKVAVHAAFKVADSIRSGKKVLVTCAAGLNRSGLVSALTLHVLYGWRGQDCVRHVREKRGLWRNPGVLSNKQFVKVLERLPKRAVSLPIISEP